MTVDDLVRAFVVERQGRWTASDVETLRKRLVRRGFAEEDPALERARAWFSAAGAHLFLCGGKPCRERSRDFAGVTAQLEATTGIAGLETSIMECQGPCKQAPVGTLRVGERCTMFAQAYDTCDWQAVYDYTCRAASERTLLADPGSAQPFLFDPVHQAEHGDTRLQQLAFLIGHFSGSGRYAGRQGTFYKEVRGAWEAGGRFIGLRMAVSYPLDDGRNDVHQALVLVGHDTAAATHAARAYTDSGTARDYMLTLDGDRLYFADRVPGHGVQARSARKVLAPRAGGYDEILETQADAEPYQTYSTVELRATSGAAAVRSARVGARAGTA